MFSFENLWPLIQQAGAPGILAGLAVLIIVFLLDFTDLLPNGNAKRTAAVILSYLFAGVEPGSLFSAVTGAIALVSSTLLKIALDAFFAWAVAQKNKPSTPGTDIHAK